MLKKVVTNNQDLCKTERANSEGSIGNTQAIHNMIFRNAIKTHFNIVLCRLFFIRMKIFVFVYDIKKNEVLKIKITKNSTKFCTEWIRTLILA